MPKPFIFSENDIKKLYFIAYHANQCLNKAAPKEHLAAIKIAETFQGILPLLGKTIKKRSGSPFSPFKNIYYPYASILVGRILRDEKWYEINKKNSQDMLFHDIVQLFSNFVFVKQRFSGLTATSNTLMIPVEIGQTEREGVILIRSYLNDLFSFKKRIVSNEKHGLDDKEVGYDGDTEEYTKTFRSIRA